MPVETIQAAIERAFDAYGALTELGETVEEEWSYVTALSEAWLTRLDRVVSSRGQEPAPGDVSTAIDRAIAEIGLIEDQHRAIDWLSTFPQVVLVALGEAP
jgi:hypothetical protein